MATNNALNKNSQELTVDPGASGDSFIQFDINTTGEFRIGVDDPAGDAFKISQGSALGTTDTFVMTAGGERTMPLQSAFLVVLDSTVANVTGDGTVYTIVWDTEIFDQNSDFDGTSTFTAPVTGRYRLEANATMGGLAAANDEGHYEIDTSNRDYYSEINPGVARDVTNNTFPYYIIVLADMDAADTAVFTVMVDGATKIVDVETNGSANPYSWFSGNLEV